MTSASRERRFGVPPARVRLRPLGGVSVWSSARQGASETSRRQFALLAICCCLGSGERLFADAASLEDAFVQVSAKVSRAVVTVNAVVTGERGKEGNIFRQESPFEEFRRRFYGEKPRTEPLPLGLGSGVLFDPDGYIVTNEHVVADAQQVTVLLASGEQYPATIRGTDPRLDLAVLKIDAGRPLPTVELGDAARLKVGQFVLAFGHPWGIEADPHPTVTVGHVSALGRSLQADHDQRRLSGLIQTDAALNPGNSGGPLADLSGKVVGINVAIFSTSGGYQGIAYAVPMNEETKRVLGQLKAAKGVEHGWIGVRTKSVTSELAALLGVQPKVGVLVESVQPGSPAAKAGLKQGDIIAAFDGKAVNTPYTLLEKIESSAVGKEAALKVLREGRETELKVVVGKKDVAADLAVRYGPRAWRGLEVADLPDGRKGVKVSKVHPNSPAWLAGIKENEVIDELNRKPVTSVDDFKSLASAAEGQDALVHTNEGYKIVKAERR